MSSTAWCSSVSTRLSSGCRYRASCPSQSYRPHSSSVKISDQLYSGGSTIKPGLTGRRYRHLVQDYGLTIWARELFGRYEARCSGVQFSTPLHGPSSWVSSVARTAIPTQRLYFGHSQCREPASYSKAAMNYTSRVCPPISAHCHQRACCPQPNWCPLPGPTTETF